MIKMFKSKPIRWNIIFILEIIKIYIYKTNTYSQFEFDLQTSGHYEIIYI